MKMNTLQQVDHKRTTKQEINQESLSLKECLKGCFPKDLNALLYALFILVYLVCALIHFAHTGNITMLTTLLPYISAYAGIDKAVSLFHGARRRTNSRTED
jgi:hypothetical protein